MYFETKEFSFKTNEELDNELTKLYHRGYKPFSYNEEWFGRGLGGRAIVKFIVEDV